MHSIFLERNKDVNHGQAVTRLITNEHLNINALDENNNTILHLMAMNINDNYYAPYFHKSNPHGNYGSVAKNFLLFESGVLNSNSSYFSYLSGNLI